MPISLGSMNRWPAQFWFDYLLLRTAGPDYRATLMAGEAAYTDPEVVNAMTLWQEAATPAASRRTPTPTTGRTRPISCTRARRP